jgi:beta-hydroxylase
MSRLAFGSAARINLRELRRRAIKLPLKKLGHAIDDWVANQSPLGDSSVIDTKAFEWVERQEKSSEVIRQELVALLYGHRIFSSSLVIGSTRATTGAQRRVSCSISIPGLSLAFFSVLAPGMHIKAHRGSYKGVLRCHLGLIVPEPRADVRMRVGDKMIYWEEGKCVIFDDTHKHEVWNDTNSIRVVLLFDVYRPLPAWLTLVNKAVLNLAYYLPEARQAVRSHREWEARSSALTRPHARSCALRG